MFDITEKDSNLVNMRTIGFHWESFCNTLIIATCFALPGSRGVRGRGSRGWGRWPAAPATRLRSGGCQHEARGCWPVMRLSSICSTSTRPYTARPACTSSAPTVVVWLKNGLLYNDQELYKSPGDFKERQKVMRTSFSLCIIKWNEFNQSDKISI